MSSFARRLQDQYKRFRLGSRVDKARNGGLLTRREDGSQRRFWDVDMTAQTASFIDVDEVTSVNEVMSTKMEDEDDERTMTADESWCP